MTDKIKAFAIGVGIIVLATLFILGLFSGGFLAWVLILIALVFSSYFIGSEVLDMYRTSKAYREGA